VIKQAAISTVTLDPIWEAEVPGCGFTYELTQYSQTAGTFDASVFKLLSNGIL